MPVSEKDFEKLSLRIDTIETRLTELADQVGNSKSRVNNTVWSHIKGLEKAVGSIGGGKTLIDRISRLESLIQKKSKKSA